MSEKISIVIPNWNGEKWLACCLDSLRKQSFQDFHVYVVDNGSVDGSVSLLETSYPEVSVIRNDTNLGFAGGINRGFSKAKGALIVALNNDVEAHPDWLHRIDEAMDGDSEAGFAASQLLDFKKRSIIDSLGDGYLPCGLSFKIGAGRMESRAPKRPVEVQSACAAASVYRASMLSEIGFFDEDFFAYMEDIDLGLRAQRAGYRCIYVPDAKVYHIGSATSGGTASAFSLRQTVRNTYRVMWKNLPLPLLPVYLAMTFLFHIFVLIFSFIPVAPDWLRGNRGAVFQGLYSAICDTPKSLRKRRNLRALQRQGAGRFLLITWRSLQLHRQVSS